MTPTFRPRTFSMLGLIAGTAVMLFSAGCAPRYAVAGTPRAQVVYRTPPTPAHTVAVQHGVQPGYVWVDGHYQWNGYEYVWVEGHYIQARQGYVYSQPRWVRRGGGYVYVAGTWNPAPRGVRHVNTTHRRTQPRRVYTTPQRRGVVYTGPQQRRGVVRTGAPPQRRGVVHTGTQQRRGVVHTRTNRVAPRGRTHTRSVSPGRTTRTRTVGHGGRTRTTRVDRRGSGRTVETTRRRGSGGSSDRPRGRRVR